MLKTALFTSALALAAAATPASAATIVCLGGGCVQNPNSQVNFDPNLIGTTINGTLNNAPGTVSFTSSETLKTQASGQARLLANDLTLNNPLTISYSGGLISALELNLDAITGGFVTFTFSGGDSGGVATLPLTVGANGSNFYNAYNGTFSSVTLSFTGGATLADVDQVRITAGPTVTAPVPEPATWALMILGFGTVGYSMRRRPSARFAQAV